MMRLETKSRKPARESLVAEQSPPLKTVLVTGGAGFIGSNFIRYLFHYHPDIIVINLDKLTYAGNLASLADIEAKYGTSRVADAQVAQSGSQSCYFFVKGDICDQDLIESLLTGRYFADKGRVSDSDRLIPDTMIHFAAESHVDRSITGPDPFIETNIIGTHTLLKAVKKVWLDQNASHYSHCRFHHVSTDEVYGSLGSGDPPFTEETAYSPNSPYAASKAASDHLVRAYYQTYGLPVTLSNCSNNYGPYQFPEKLIPLVIVNALEGKSLPVYGDGLNIRDWLHVEDHCRGIERVIKKGKPGGTYNIGGNNEQTNINIVKLICGQIDEAFKISESLRKRFPVAPAANGGATESLISFVKDRPGHDRRYAINASKAAKELGYAPRESFQTGLRKTLTWYLNNESWWRNIMNGSYRKWIKEHYKA
jgi:dTDP-glucose 4,6-dehydratase